jgi:hypothetical protein
MDVKRTCGEKTEQSKKEGAGRKKNWAKILWEFYANKPI